MGILFFQQDKCCPVERVGELLAYGALCFEESLSFVARFQPMVIEQGHHTLRCFVVHLPQTHDDASHARFLEATLQPEHTVGFQCAQSRLTSRENQQVGARQVVVGQFSSGDDAVITHLCEYQSAQFQRQLFVGLLSGES